MSQVHRSSTVYDVCIVGSGAAGGTAAKILTEGGLNVALLEAGPPLNPADDFKEHVWPYDLPHRGAGMGGNALKPGNGLENEFIAPTGA
jgi:choline dehydrogenase-like flavoprotein